MNAPNRAAATGRPWWYVARDAVLRGIGLAAGDRGSIVDGIVIRHGKDALTYWLQLAIATGIATLGVVLNSTAVVIGAMLISPLMEPIVGFGMALAVGAPILAVRSTYRLAVSIAAVVAASALLTLVLPFHEVTPEIAARTSPTLLDLGVAVFCAISAAFTTMRRSSDTVSTAAGTAIGIALVPPLCVVGFGLGAGLPVVARGAALLFTANLAAIILVSTVLFILAGFGTAQSTVEAEAYHPRQISFRFEQYLAKPPRRNVLAKYLCKSLHANDSIGVSIDHRIHISIVVDLNDLKKLSFRVRYPLAPPPAHPSVHCSLASDCVGRAAVDVGWAGTDTRQTSTYHSGE